MPSFFLSFVLFSTSTIQQSNVGLDDLRGMEGTSSRSWSHLSQGLLELILKFLTPVNHLRFGSVCRPWRIAQRESLHPPAQDLPFHIVCRDIDDTHGESIQLFSLSEKKIYRKPLHRHFTYDAFSVPYSSWLFLYDPHEKIQFLFNPFITNGFIDLPEQESRRYNECLFFSTPAHPDGVLLLKSERNNKFLPCRLNPWSDHQYYEWQEPFIVSDWDKETCPVMSNAIFFQGKLYALNEDGGLSVVDTLFPHDFAILNMSLENNSDVAVPPVEWHHKAVMLESCGEILLVLRGRKHWTRNVAVFRANLTELEWVTVENLGDRALLIFNPSSSVSVCTTGTDFRSNCV